MSGTFLNTLKFMVKDCDPNTGEPDSDVGFADEYVVSIYGCAFCCCSVNSTSAVHSLLEWSVEQPSIYVLGSLYIYVFVYPAILLSS